MISRLSLKMKMVVGFGTLLLILVAAGLVGLRTVGKLSDISDGVDDIMTKTELANQIEGAVEKQTTGVRGYLLAGKEELLKHDEDGKSEYRSRMDQLDKRLVTEEGKKLHQQIARDYEVFRAIVEREIELRRSGRAKEAVELAFSPRTGEARTALRASVAALIELEDSLKKQTLEEQTKTENSARFEMIGLTVIGLVVGLVVATVISRSISQGINRMVAMIEQVAGNNLAVADLEITSADEIGSASKALNTMKNGLRDMIQSIAGTAEHVASASEEISSSATQQAQSFETQKDETTQVATAMQEMASTVQQISENSNRAADAARQAADTARHGGSIVDETLAKMRSISAAVSGTARKMEELGKSSDQIGRIIGVIDDIADQTNLLALNAAIEAARAGEQGRGFAVVADEVRKLAERTTTATKEIAQMIKNIQDETRSAVTAMEDGTRQVDEGVNTTAKAGASLQEIIQTSEQVGEMITHIATAATEQSSATEQVNRNMDEISKLVKESAIGVQQSAKACQDLSSLALDMQRMVGNFRLDSAARGSGMKQPGHVSYAQQAGLDHEAEVARAFAAGSN